MVDELERAERGGDVVHLEARGVCCDDCSGDDRVGAVKLNTWEDITARCDRRANHCTKHPKVRKLACIIGNRLGYTVADR